MDRKSRKHISFVSKRHLRRLAAQESQTVCNTVLKNISKIKPITHIGKDTVVCDTLSENNNITDVIDFDYNSFEDRKLNNLPQFNDISSNESISCVKFQNENCTDGDIQSNLAAWAVECQISHTALKALFHILKQHSCFSTFPIDPRTFLKTPRKQEVRLVAPGIYYHFGLFNSLSNIITSTKNNDNCIKITINIDGLPISRSSPQQFWPILGSIYSDKRVFTIGIYHGNAKPANTNDFLKDFVDEAKEMCENGLNNNDRNIECRIEALICDAPAKAFILSVKGHTGHFSCTKCITEGEYIERRICFPQTDAPLRLDNDFKQKIDENYHNPNITCSLLEIPHFQPVTNVPLDYMHLACLGIMRKLIYLWLTKELHYRLSHRAIEEISTCLSNQLKPSIPVEFARKPRGLDCIKQWKATEYRQLLLYTGPLAFQSTLKRNVYINFMVFHVIIRILSSRDLHEYLSYAQDLILFFIKTFIKLYGKHNVSHNVHNLIHLVNDVRQYGPLDNFSAFKFENYLQTLKKMLRKSDKPLQQIIRRCIEKENLSTPLSSVLLHSSIHPHLISLHTDGPLVSNCTSPQYKAIKYNEITFKVRTLADNCCGLNCGAIICIENVAFCAKRNIPMIIGYEFLKKEDLFSVPCASSLLGIYKVHSFSPLKSWPLKNIIRKYVKFFCKDNKYAVFPLLHCEM